MTEYRKVKRIKMPPKTKRQLDTSRMNGLKTMLTKNPMKNPAIVEKVRKANLGKKCPKTTLRNILNNPSKIKPGFKGKKHTKESKMKNSMKHLGKKGNAKSREQCLKNVLFNNPMKNPIIAKKNAESRKLKLPKEILEKVISEFNVGKSISQLGNENKVDPGALSRLLKREGVIINIHERRILYNKINPDIRKTQFKKGGQNIGNKTYQLFY